MSIEFRFAVCLSFSLLACWVWTDRFEARGQEKKPGSAAAAAKPADDGFGNVQVLKGERDLLPTMHFIRASLGVRCDYCHVAENGKYRLDDKPAKIRAREHIVMTRQINEVAYGGKLIVTCNTCHRGSPKPVAIPSIITDVVNTTRREPFEPLPPALPSPEEIFAKYEAATHTGTIPPARLELEVLRGKLIDGGTPAARMIPRADKTLVEAVVDGDRGATTTRLSNGQTARVGSTGDRIWVLGANGTQWISTGDLAQIRRRINPLLVLRVRISDYASVAAAGIEKIDGAEAYAVTATAKDGSVETLWFAKANGLLLRRTFYHPTLLGPEPEQYDLSEYKTYGNLRLPTVINASYLDDQHLGILKRLLKVQLGAPVTNTDFEPPAR
jgi:photosynthetic reaction center cytochrome c subunit